MDVWHKAEWRSVFRHLHRSDDRLRWLAVKLAENLRFFALRRYAAAR